MHCRYVSAALAFATLPLAGCGNPDTGPKSIEEAQEEAAKLDRPRPGQYKQTMTVTRFEVPNAPPEMAEQFKAALGQGHDTQFCLTEDMAQQGFKDMFREIGKDGECAYERFDVAGNKLDAVLNCESAAEGKGRITLSGTVGPEGSVVEVNIDSDNPNSPVGKTRIGMQMVSERLGDCAAVAKD